MKGTYDSEYYLKNKEKLKAKAKDYYYKNKDDCLAARHAYYETHKNLISEKVKAKNAANPLPNRQRVTKWQQDNPKQKFSNHRRHLLKKHGLTPEQYTSLLEQQDNKCAICRVLLVGEGLQTHIDHDHKTLKVRGVLCFNCNVGLGNFRDNIPIMQQAINYLQRTT